MKRYKKCGGSARKKTEPDRLARKALDQLISAVEAGKSETFRAYLALMAKFHRYSVGNVLLIAAQQPHATRVAGFRAWQRLGRKVKSGEKGIRILAPIRFRRTDEDEEDKEVRSFRTVCVFDVSQTDGRPLPEFAKVKGDPGGLTDRLRAFAREKGIDVVYSASIGAAQGASAGGRIMLKPGLDHAEECSVLVHELAHERMHRDGETKISRTVRETEAEAVAFCVCHAIGLDTNSAASDYIQLYRGTKETLVESLGRIRQAATEIIVGVEGERPGAGEPVRGAAA